MEVVLLENIKKLGKIGDIVNVKRRIEKDKGSKYFINDN